MVSLSTKKGTIFCQYNCQYYTDQLLNKSVSYPLPLGEKRMIRPLSSFLSYLKIVKEVPTGQKEPKLNPLYGESAPLGEGGEDPVVGIDSTVADGILGELKYRALYLFLIVAALVGLVYLNLGIRIEYLGSYYSSYHQTIDFNWQFGIIELNDKVATKSNFSQLLKPTNGYFTNSSEATTQIKAVIGQPNLEKVVQLEVDEFNGLFISLLSVFSGNSGAIMQFSSLGTITEAPGTISSIIFQSTFYNCILFFGHHCLCFLGPAAITGNSRLKVFWIVQILLLTLLIHSLALPYVVAVYEELQIENLDSELYQPNRVTFVDCFIACSNMIAFLVVCVNSYVMIKTLKPNAEDIN